MKITLQYAEAEEEGKKLTLRLTLPQKHIDGPTKAVVKLFIDYYNKKTGASLDAEGFHLKVVGGAHLDREGRVVDGIKAGNELYVLPGAEPLPSQRAAKVAKVADAQPKASAAPKAPKKDEQGRVRCRNFGCKKWFFEDGPPQECVHHCKPPVFHETAKWWSCCQDKKAYDFGEFERIPGCTKGFCSAVVQQGQSFLGGSDLRGDCAPQRIDEAAPEDPRKKLNAMRAGLVAIGVDATLYENVWSRLLGEADSDHAKVAERFKARFSQVLEDAR
jgi:hypothetical protein